MKENSWKDIAELIGIAAIVASLIFVGLQMKQSQDIALAAQYQARTDTIVNLYSENKQHAIGAELWGNLMKTWPDDELGMSAAGEAIIRNMEPQQLAWVYYELSSQFRIHENHHYQYQAGFLDEESSRAFNSGLKAFLSSAPLAVDIWEGEKKSFRESFRIKVDSVIDEIE